MVVPEISRPVAFNDNIPNILVVDDRRDIINVIQIALEEQPVNFYSAGDGRAAMRELETRPFDLLLLDAKMPGLSGFEVCRMVKNHPLWHSTKIIMISASNVPDDKIRAFDVGADDYVTKPFRVQELKARVQVMLNLRTAERALTQRNDQLLELIRVSERLNRQLNLDDTAKEVVKSATRLTRADRAYLPLWDPVHHIHYFVAAENPVEGLDVVLNSVMPAGRGLAALVQERGQMVIVPNYQTFAGNVPNLLVDSYETAGVPLRIGDRHIGVLVVTLADPERHFATADLDILATLANQAAIAIDNAQLYTDLARESEKYRLIAEKASDLIISLDANGSLTYVNERLKAILGYEPEEILGKKLENFLAQEGQATLNQLILDLMRQSTDFPSGVYDTQQRELLAVSKEGVPVNLEFNFGLFYQPGSQGKIAGIQAIGRDVTARKRSEENERMRMIGQIASGVAHDLNNVLANVLGHAQLLKIEVEDPEIIDTIQIIEQSALDGAETVRRIQEFTVQRMQQNLDIVDLNAVVQSTIDLSRPRWRDDAQQHGMRVEVNRNLGDIPPVQGKAAELREVLVNLVNNAIDAMPAEGGNITFRTYLETPETACLEVRDTGKGMDAEVKRHIFEPFYTTKGVGGTGLGLSVAYSIIARFGGRISVDSSPGQGTTFYIRLPVSGPNEAEVIRPQKSGKSHQLTKRFNGRILAVDDESNLRNVLHKALSIAGFEVDVADGGVEALERLQAAADRPGQAEKPYDLVLSDLGMPGMSGWEVAAELNRRWPLIPLVLVTGWGDHIDPVKLANHRIASTIAKPFNIHDLVTLAGKLIEGKKTG
jgi:PAS domain S-box-containing protein